MQRFRFLHKMNDKAESFLLADISVIAVVLVLGFGVAGFVDLGNTAFVAEMPVNTSLVALPFYALLSLIRSLISLVLSYMFAIAVGTLAARKPAYERIIIPLLDIGQSIPLVTFMPGTVFALTMLFPHSRWGLELACIILIFTCQVWNLAFAWYEAQVTLPKELVDVTRIVGLSPFQRFLLLDFPHGLRPLIYNGMMSMAGGWFFLTVCEAFLLSGRNFRLPGLGSYMKVAFDSGNTPSFVAGLAVMAGVIIGVDFFLWKPLVAWSSRFRDLSASEEPGSSLFLRMLERTRLIRLVSARFERLLERGDTVLKTVPPRVLVQRPGLMPSSWARIGHWSPQSGKTSPSTWRATLGAWVLSFGMGALVFALLPSLPKAARIAGSVSRGVWVHLINSLAFTFVEVLAVLFLATLWTLPVGIWIGMNARVSRIAQPVVQNIAAFPVPMLFPLIAMALSRRGVPPHVIAVVLMLMGNQWYMFFNVISGAARITDEFKLVAQAYRFSLWKKWRRIYLPAVFPSLVTGWLTAAGGSWNASIVAEYVTFPGGELRTPGIGLDLQLAAERGDVFVLAAGVSIMTIALVILNRSIWRSLQLYAENLKA